MTTLAVPRSLRTSATSACHALVDAKMDHRVTCLKIQGYLIWRELAGREAPPEPGQQGLEFN